MKSISWFGISSIIIIYISSCLETIPLFIKVFYVFLQKRGPPMITSQKEGKCKD